MHRYLFDGSFDVDTDLGSAYEVPAPFREDLFDLLSCPGAPAPVNNVLRPDHKWLLAGPARAGTALHQDPVGSAWNAVVIGAKRWVAVPPCSAVLEDVTRDRYTVAAKAFACVCIHWLLMRAFITCLRVHLSILFLCMDVQFGIRIECVRPCRAQDEADLVGWFTEEWPVLRSRLRDEGTAFYEFDQVEGEVVHMVRGCVRCGDLMGMGVRM